jgi:hypothetical protein
MVRAVGVTVLGGVGVDDRGPSCSSSLTTHEGVDPSAANLTASGGVGAAGLNAGVGGVGEACAPPTPELWTPSCAETVSRFWLEGPNSSWIDESTPTVMTPPQTEQRARTPSGGTLDGSTRKTDLHSGQETFTSPPVPLR